MSCPVCARETHTKYRPFCSKRCADVDLARWVNGAYAVPMEETDDIEAAMDTAREAQNKPH